jgi:hypothetical protein
VALLSAGIAYWECAHEWLHGIASEPRYDLHPAAMESSTRSYPEHSSVADHCDRLPSILDLMSPSCGGRQKPTAVTAGDLAFLKALYYRNTGFGPSLSIDDIHDNMMRQFKQR